MRTLIVGVLARCLLLWNITLAGAGWVENTNTERWQWWNDATCFRALGGVNTEVKDGPPGALPALASSFPLQLGSQIIEILFILI